MSVAVPDGYEGCKGCVHRSFKYAHDASQLPFLAGRRGHANGGAAKTDAARINHDNHEYLWGRGDKRVAQAHSKVVHLALSKQ
jgi:hypothetical protein